jgi:hypothetical protein
MRTVQRQRLRRQPGNDGRTLILVPPEMTVSLAKPVRAQARQSTDISALRGDTMVLIEAKLAAAEARADGAIALADRTLAMLADAQARGDQAIERERAWWSMPRWRRVLAAWRGY